jgi:hypothetical protein
VLRAFVCDRLFADYWHSVREREREEAERAAMRKEIADRMYEKVKREMEAEMARCGSVGAERRPKSLGVGFFVGYRIVGVEGDWAWESGFHVALPLPAAHDGLVSM